MIISLLDLYKAIGHKHSEDVNFRRYYRTLPNGKIVPVSSYHRMMEIKGGEDNERSIARKENRGDQGILSERGYHNRKSKPGLRSNPVADRFFARWRDSVLEISKENKGLSIFKKGIIKTIGDIVKHWPNSAINFLAHRLDSKKQFVVLKDKKDIDHSILSIYEKSRGVCLDGEQIDIVEGIHSFIDDEILRHETTHLLIHAISQEMIRRGKNFHAINCENIIDSVVTDKLKNIENIITFCSNDNWNKSVGGINTGDLEKLTRAVNTIRFELKDNEAKHKQSSMFAGTYDEMPSLLVDLGDKKFDISKPLKTIGDYLKLKTPTNRQVAIILWHKWIAEKYNARILHSYLFDEPVSYECADNPEMFNKLFAAAQKDFPELFTVKNDLKKSLLIRLYNLYKSLKPDTRKITWENIEHDIQSRGDKKDDSFFLDGAWKNYLREQGGYSVFQVDGDWVRNNLSIMFGHGGHGLVHEFIPKNEIWVSNRMVKDGKVMDEKYRDGVIVHEISENKTMKDGEKYWNAHQKANEEEKKSKLVKSIIKEHLSHKGNTEFIVHEHTDKREKQRTGYNQDHAPNNGIDVKPHPKSIRSEGKGGTVWINKIENGKAELSTEGDFGHLSGQKFTMPQESISHFILDMMGKVHGFETKNESVNAVLRGEAELLGKGQEGLAFKVGDKIVKVSTTTPYIATNDTHRTPKQSMDLIKESSETQNKLHDFGIPGIPKVEYIESGEKAFQVKDYVEEIKDWKLEYITQMAETIKSMHDHGYTMNDIPQAGLKNGKIMFYDIGFAKKLDQNNRWAEEDMDGDYNNLSILAEKNGLKLNSSDIRDKTAKTPDEKQWRLLQKDTMDLMKKNLTGKSEKEIKEHHDDIENTRDLINDFYGDLEEQSKKKPDPLIAAYIIEKQKSQMLRRLKMAESLSKTTPQKKDKVTPIPSHHLPDIKR